MINKRVAFLLTGNINSSRAILSKKVLEKIGFHVVFIIYLPHEDNVLSNKLSMQYIYSLFNRLIHNYAYVFEDDINIKKNITLDEIIKYERISPMFFYLGICEVNCSGVNKTNIKINNHDVYTKSGNVRGLHAIGLSKKGAVELLNFSKKSNEKYMDVILEQFSLLYPANVVRYDLSSYIQGHKGIIFQDRVKFPSQIK